MIITNAKCLLDDVLFLIVGCLYVKRSPLRYLLASEVWREFLVLSCISQKWPLFDHFRFVIQRVSLGHVVWRGRLSIHGQLTVLEIYFLVGHGRLGLDGFLLGLSDFLVEHVCPRGHRKRFIDKRTSESALKHKKSEKLETIIQIDC